MRSKKLFFMFFVVISLVFSSISYFANAAVDLNSEDTQFKYSEVRQLHDGGKAYVYNIDGIRNVFPVPPKGFNPLKATDEQLSEYGFPPRPKDEEGLKQWQHDMKQYKNTTEPNKVFKKSRRKEKNRNSLIDGANSNSYNWTGYTVNFSTNNCVSIQGDYKQPAYNSNSLTNSRQLSFIGIGGAGNGLVQAGTSMYANTYSAWYQYIGRNGEGPYAIFLPNLAVKSGDNIHLYVSYETSNKKVNFYIANNTTGKNQSIIVENLDPAIYYDGTQAAWIDERPTVNNVIVPLANYGSNSWTNCQFYSKTGVWRNLGYSKYNSWTMKNSSSETLAYPSSLTSQTSFKTYYAKGK